MSANIVGVEKEENKRRSDCGKTEREREREREIERDI